MAVVAVVAVASVCVVIAAIHSCSYFGLVSWSSLTGGVDVIAGRSGVLRATCTYPLSSQEPNDFCVRFTCSQ